MCHCITLLFTVNRHAMKTKSIKSNPLFVLFNRGFIVILVMMSTMLMAQTPMGGVFEQVNENYFRLNDQDRSLIAKYQKDKGDYLGSGTPRRIPNPGKTGSNATKCSIIKNKFGSGHNLRISC